MGVPTVSLSGGSRVGADAARAVLGDSMPWTASAIDASVLDSGTLIVVGTPDDAIASAATDLAAAASGAGRGRGLAIVHLSGLHDASVLSAMADHGAVPGGFHPLRSFATRDDTAPDLAGALVAVEADDSLAPALHGWATQIGGRPFALTASARPLYHLGAATAGNTVLAVLDLAASALAAAGVPGDLATAGLATLMHGALDNAARTDVASSLTGPVVRGDVTTLQRHLEAIDATLPAVRSLYLELIRGLLDVCARRDDAERSAPVRTWLDEVGS